MKRSFLHSPERWSPCSLNSPAPPLCHPPWDNWMLSADASLERGATESKHHQNLCKPHIYWSISFVSNIACAGALRHWQRGLARSLGVSEDHLTFQYDKSHTIERGSQSIFCGPQFWDLFVPKSFHRVLDIALPHPTSASFSKTFWSGGRFRPPPPFPLA